MQLTMRDLESVGSAREKQETQAAIFSHVIKRMLSNVVFFRALPDPNTPSISALPSCPRCLVACSASDSHVHGRGRHAAQAHAGDASVDHGPAGAGGTSTPASRLASPHLSPLSSSPAVLPHGRPDLQGGRRGQRAVPTTRLEPAAGSRAPGASAPSLSLLASRRQPCPPHHAHGRLPHMAGTCSSRDASR